jgi:DNA-binding MarR family transcriptional regulator
VSSTHPRHRLDARVHSPIRLSVMAILSGVDEATFSFVAETVQLSAPMLSKHVTILEDAGYVTVRKGSVGRRPRTWLALTAAGRTRFADHVAALRAITDSAGEQPGGQRGLGD